MVLPGVVRLRLEPWEGPQLQTVVFVSEARLKTVETYPDEPSDLERPDILGLDGDE